MNKKIVGIGLCASLLSLSSCEFHFNSYVATMLVKSNRYNDCSLSYDSLKGNIGFTITVDGDQYLVYSASIGEGEANVYIEIDGNKELLFTITPDKIIESNKISVGKGKMYVSYECPSTCKNGSFEAHIEN